MRVNMKILLSHSLEVKACPSPEPLEVPATRRGRLIVGTGLVVKDEKEIIVRLCGVILHNIEVFVKTWWIVLML